MIVKNFKFDTRYEWFVNSSLPWFRTIICCLEQISPLEYLLKVFSEYVFYYINLYNVLCFYYAICYTFSSLIYTKTFIQVLSTILPDYTNINNLDGKKPTHLSIDVIKSDLKELRRVFKEYAGEQITIPRNQWNDTRMKLVSAII